MDSEDTPSPPPRRNRHGDQLQQSPSMNKPILNLKAPPAAMHPQNFVLGPFGHSSALGTHSSEPPTRNNSGVSPVDDVYSGRGGGTPSSEPPKRKNSPGVSPASLSEAPVRNVDSVGGDGTPSFESPKRKCPGVSPAALSEAPVGNVDSVGGGRTPSFESPKLKCPGVSPAALSEAPVGNVDSVGGGRTPSFESPKRKCPGVSPAALSEAPVRNVDSVGGGGTPSSEPPKRKCPGVSPAALSEAPVGNVDSVGGGGTSSPEPSKKRNRPGVSPAPTPSPGFRRRGRRNLSLLRSSSEPPKRNNSGVSPLDDVESGRGGGASSSRSPAALSEAPVGNVDSGRGRGRGNRGRPRGRGRVMDGLLGLPGYDYKPHIITVYSGEDIASTILAYSLQQEPHRVCILSANGTIASVTLRGQPPSGGTVSYEGRFGILSLNGTFPKKSDDNSGTDVLTLAMFGLDYRVYGGAVSGILRAASPIQIVLISFICEEDKKPKGGGALTSPTPSPSPLPPSTQVGPVVQAD